MPWIMRNLITRLLMIVHTYAFNTVINDSTYQSCVGFQTFASWMQYKQADGAIPNT